MKKVLFFILVLATNVALAQTKSFTVKYVNEPITLDGLLNEAVWSETDVATNFFQHFPTDSVQSKAQAEIRMLYDDDNLYVGMKVNSGGNNYVVPSLRRDFRAGGSDNITLMFDTFNDGSNAFLFGTNPEGVKREMLLSGGGVDIRGFTTAWDTKWRSETVKHDNYYTVEWIIPFYAVKYKEGETKWRFNCYHFDTQYNENNTWINIPQNQFIFNLAFMGDMIFEKPLGKSKSPISLIPYVNSLVGKDYDADDTTTDLKFGGDAKMTIGSSLNLDFTANPDFSQVEVDQQVVNLTRFEIGLPERRQFFIENADLFGDFGNARDANPFFSRRIGIGQDLDGNNIENDIIAGIRLSGKVNTNLRVGVLNMQTVEDKDNEIPTANNAVLTLQQKLFSRSNISVMFINKQATKDYDFLADEDKYNRVVGIDYRLASADNTWTGKYYFHKSFSPNVSNNDYSTGASTTYNSRNWSFRASGLFVGNNFRSDLGFIRRKDIFKIDPNLRRNFWPKKGKVQQHSLSVTPIFIWRPELDFENSDYTIITRWEANFQNSARANAEMFNRYVRLYDEFDPTGTEGAVPLPPGDYKYTSFSASFRSDQRKVFSYGISPSGGQFFNGNIYSLRADINYRIQPHFNMSLFANYDSINLPDPYPDANIVLIGSRFDVTFSKSVFWATFIQYNNQSDNFGINSRLQWRFAPLSDLFLVYNDNYFTDNVFAPRVRSINLKVTYWLNI